MQRTTLLEFKDEDSGVAFRVERWFMPVDDAMESLIKVALIWDDGRGTDRVVLLGRKIVRAVIDELGPFA